MTRFINHTWLKVNKALSVINVMLFALVCCSPVDLRKANDRHVPLFLNILLLFLLSATLGLFIYGDYRRHL